MVQIKKIIRDILYVSKVTRVGNKKFLVTAVALISQLVAISDIAIIAIFASIIADQFTNIDFVNNSDDFDNLLEVIQEPAQGRKYFNPS